MYERQAQVSYTSSRLNLSIEIIIFLACNREAFFVFSFNLTKAFLGILTDVFKTSKERIECIEFKLEAFKES